MELISALAEAQKCQEATLNEMKIKLEDNQSKLDRIIAERQSIANELDECKHIIKDLNSEKLNLQKELDALLLNSQSEVTQLKTIINNNENEWKKLLNERKIEIESIEKKLSDTELELTEALHKIAMSNKKECGFNKEFKKLKCMEMLSKEEMNKLRTENLSLHKNLKDLKMDQLKMANNNDRLVDEIKWARKSMETFKELWENVKQEKVVLEQKNESILISFNKNRLLEKELKDLKLNLLNITNNNRAIEDAVISIKASLMKNVKHASVQSEMTGIDLSQYEHLDREATLLVVGLREELVSAKDELIKAKRDNEEMKEYINGARKQIEIEEEEQRVQRLEQTVKSLTDLIYNDLNSHNNLCGSGKYSVRNSPAAIMNSLEDVKKDLALLKTRSWNRVVKAEIEQPTRDRTDQSSMIARPHLGGLNAVNFSRRNFFHK